MPYANDPEMLGITPCNNCGRRSDKAHCIHCGSYDNRALSTTSKRPDPQTGVMTVVYNYVCRRCGRRYDDFDWKYNCHAPDYLPSRGGRIKTAKALKMNPLTNPVLQAALEKQARAQVADIMKKKREQEELDNDINNIKSKTGEIQ